MLRTLTRAASKSTLIIHKFKYTNILHSQTQQSIQPETFCQPKKIFGTWPYINVKLNGTPAVANIDKSFDFCNAPYKLATDLGLKSHPALLTRGILFGYLTCVELDVAGSKTQMVAVVERESFPYPLVFSKEQIIGFNLVVKDTEFHINEYNQDSVEDKHYNLSGKWLELLHEKGITEKDLVPIADLPDCQDTFYKLSEQERAKLYRTKSFCYWYKGKKIWV